MFQERSAQPAYQIEGKHSPHVSISPAIKWFLKISLIYNMAVRI